MLTKIGVNLRVLNWWVFRIAVIYVTYVHQSYEIISRLKTVIEHGLGKLTVLSVGIRACRG